MKKLFTSITMLLLALSPFALTSCEEEDDYIAQQLRSSDWEGYIGTYYSNRWNISGNEYETVWHFESRGNYYTSGRGAELNYDTRSRYQDYAYCTFKWFIVDGEITFIYDDSKWQPIYIVDYYLSSTNFRGYIYDGTSTRIKFDLQSTSYSDWGDYNRRGYGGYGDFSNQNYFRARQAPSFGTDSIPFIDRTPYLVAEDGEKPCCVMSGKFAEAYQNMK